MEEAPTNELHVAEVAVGNLQRLMDTFTDTVNSPLLQGIPERHITNVTLRKHIDEVNSLLQIITKSIKNLKK